MTNCTFFSIFTLQEWEVVNGFANWLAAIGTISAVIVALWLARRQEHPRVTLHAEVSSVWFEKGSEKNREYLEVRAVNVGDRPVTISHLSLRFGLFRKLWVGVPIPDKEVSSPFPIEITYGKEATWLIPLEKDNFKWREDVAKFLADASRSTRIRFASVYATTTTGKIFKAHSGGSVAAAFNKVLKNVGSEG